MGTQFKFYITKYGPIVPSTQDLPVIPIPGTSNKPHRSVITGESKENSNMKPGQNPEAPHNTIRPVPPISSGQCHEIRKNLVYSEFLMIGLDHRTARNKKNIGSFHPERLQETARAVSRDLHATTIKNSFFRLLDNPPGAVYNPAFMPD
jgi:hypothetical protein